MLALVLAAVAVLLVGCGASSNAKDEFIARGDAICSEFNKAEQEILTTHRSVNSAKQLYQEAEFYPAMVERLKRFDAPDESDDYSAFVSAANELYHAEAEAMVAVAKKQLNEKSALAKARSEAAAALASFQSAA
jgi:hypothetical protein